MSMLSVYINRAGKGLAKSRKRKLENAKDALRARFGKARKAETTARARRKRPRRRSKNSD